VSVAALARERGISEILHYTSQHGVMGSIAKWRVLSRARLEDDEDLAFIFEGVWPRRDPAWVDYISLSVSAINASLYNSSRQNHPEWWWAVLSFELEILDHEGVWFTTTNNVYDDVCRRAQGTDGFEDMFSEAVPWGYWGSVKRRTDRIPDHLTTDRAAEVLYPGQLSLDYLQRIYVPGAQHRRLVHAWCDTYGRTELPVEVNLTVFS
jgi:hypothetical protein